MNETRISYEELNAAGLHDTPVGNFCIDFAKSEIRLMMAYYNPERDDYDNYEYIFDDVEQLSVSGLQIGSFEWGAEIQ